MKDRFVCAQLVSCDVCKNMDCRKNPKYKKKKNTIRVGEIEFEYNPAFPGPLDAKLLYVRDIRKGDVIYPCKCDPSVGENCEKCYSPRGTKPCLHRYCGDCGIDGCSVRIVEKENG